MWRVFDSQIANESSKKNTTPSLQVSHQSARVDFLNWKKAIFSLAVILRLAETIELIG